MDELKQVKPISLVSWPSPQDYNEAVQNPEQSFADSSLGSSLAETDSFGLPRPNTGMFASVYQMHGLDGDWALRCFLHFVPDQVERYAAIGQALNKANLASTLRFELQERGVRVRGNWYPVLKMQWCEGETLDCWLEENLHDPNTLNSFLSEWKTVMGSLQNAGIAHGDLQHANVLIDEGRITIVDYDGMYVPSLQGRLSNELGHRDFQHPGRTQQNYGPGLDNFSAWVIYLSVLILKSDPRLWDELNGGYDCLIFRQRDFEQPLHSPAFHLLENHTQEEIRQAAQTLRFLLSLSPDQIPPLSEPPLVSSLPALLEPHHFSSPVIDNTFDNGLGGHIYTEGLDTGPLSHNKKRQRSRLKGGASGFRRFAPALEEETPNLVSAEMLSPLAQLVRKVSGQSDFSGQTQSNLAGGNSPAISPGLNGAGSTNSNGYSGSVGTSAIASQLNHYAHTDPLSGSGSGSAGTIWQWKDLWKKLALILGGCLGTFLFLGVTFSHFAWHEPHLPVLDKGIEYLHEQKFADAIKEFQNVFDTLQEERQKRVGDPAFDWRNCTATQAWSCVQLGAAHFGERRYEDALDNFSKAHELFQQIKPGDSIELAHTLGLEGRAYQALDRIGNASGCYSEAVAMYERMGVHPFLNQGMADCMSGQTRNSLAGGHY